MSTPVIDIAGLTRTYGTLNPDYMIEFITVLYFAGLTMLLIITSFRLYRHKNINL